MSEPTKSFPALGKFSLDHFSNQISLKSEALFWGNSFELMDLEIKSLDKLSTGFSLHLHFLTELSEYAGRFYRKEIYLKENQKKISTKMNDKYGPVLLGFGKHEAFFIFCLYYVCIRLITTNKFLIKGLGTKSKSTDYQDHWSIRFQDLESTLKNYTATKNYIKDSAWFDYFQNLETDFSILIDRLNSVRESAIFLGFDPKNSNFRLAVAVLKGFSTSHFDQIIASATADLKSEGHSLQQELLSIIPKVSSKDLDRDPQGEVFKRVINEFLHHKVSSVTLKKWEDQKALLKQVEEK